MLNAKIDERQSGVLSDEKRFALESSLEYIDNLKATIKEILNGRSVSASCKDNNINLNQFIKFISKDKSSYQGKNISDDVKTRESRESIGKIILSWQERLYADIFATKDFSDIPCDAAESISYVLQFLTKNQIKIILMKYKEELSNTEIAERLGTTTDRVKISYIKAIRRLRRPDSTKILYGGPEYYKQSLKYRKTMTHNLHSSYIDNMKKSTEQAIRNNDMTELLKLRSMIDSRISEAMGEIPEDYMTKKCKELEAKIPLRNVPINVVGFSARTHNVLMRNNITTLDVLDGTDTEKLSHLRGMGTRSLEEVVSKSSEYGYKIVCNR